MTEENSNQSIERDKRKSQRKTRFIILLFGLVLLTGSLYSVSIDLLTYLAGVQMVTMTSWDRTIPGQAWSFQREMTTSTDQQGMLIPIVGEGERVSKGLEIARLNYMGDTRLDESSNRRIYSVVAGIVSYEPDGLEIIGASRDYGDLTIQGLEDIIGPDDSGPPEENQGFAFFIQERLETDDRGPEEGADGSDGGGEEKPSAAEKALPRKVDADTVILKVTDNLSDCYVYARLPWQEEAPFLETDALSMKLEDGSQGWGTALQCERIDSGWGVLIRLESGLEALRHSRRHQLTLVLETEEKAAVPAGSVVMRDGVTGVYTAEKNRALWVPIRVIGEKDGSQVVEGLENDKIRPGILIASRPWIIWDGMRIRG